VDAAIQSRMPALRVIAVAGAGSDAIDHVAAARRGVEVLTAGEALTETTADLAFGLIISASRLMHEAETTLRAGRWQGWRFLDEFGQDVSGATLGLVGFGAIGRAVARRAGGFGMRVLHHTRNPTRAPGWVAELDALLRASDIVSVHVPLTTETRGLIDERRIGLLGPTAVLVNTSRGPVVDEDALADALTAGRLFAAGLDVYDQEPLVSPRLLEAPRAVLLPHVGSATLRTREAMLRGAAVKVQAFLAPQSVGG
jgi:glyoxylate reductase